jgi:hypothetical protein
MRKLLAFALITLAVCSRGAQTPSQVLASASAWQQLSDRDLRIASSYLLLQLAGLSTTPTGPGSSGLPPNCILVRASQDQCLIQNNTGYLNAGQLIGTASGAYKIRNNLSVSNNAAGDQVTLSGTVDSDYNGYSGTWGFGSEGAHSKHASIADFSSPVQLSGGSALVGAGETQAGFNNDYAGNARSVPWDIGAYEYQSPATFLGGTGSGGGGTFGSWRTQ